MLAAVHSAGRIHIRQVDPLRPSRSQLLIRVRATTVSAADYRFARALRAAPGRFFTRLRSKPVVLGMELSGTVEAVGPDVTRFRPGDEVFGLTGTSFAAHAEFALAPETRIAHRPASISLRDAGAVAFGGLTAVCFLRDANIQPGQRVLIYGASGSVGVFAVQLAKHFGAEVTGVCSTANVGLVQSLGADHVVDYTHQDFSTCGQRYDVIVDTVGYSGFSRSLRVLKRGGPYVRIAPSGGISWPRMLLSMIGDTARGAWISATGAATMMGGVPKDVEGGLAALKRLLDDGHLRTVIDRTYPLAQIADAFAYAETGHKRGHVLIEP